MPFVQAGGHRLEYAWLGPGPEEAPSVVMLHEGLGSLAMWKDFPAAVQVRTGLGVLAYSRQGYGRSEPIEGPRQPDFMHREARVVLPELLETLDVRDPILLGHSDGGSIALIHAGTPDLPGPRPRAAIALAAHVFNEDLCVASIAAARKAYQTTNLRERLARYHSDVDGAFFGWNDVWLLPEFRDWTIEDVLPLIECPLLVLQGEDDQYGTMAQVEAICAGAGGPTEAVTVPNCGHSIHVDATETALAHIARFVGKAIGTEAAA